MSAAVVKKKCIFCFNITGCITILRNNIGCVYNNGTKKYTQVLKLVYKHNELLHVRPTTWPFSGMYNRKVRYIAFYTCTVTFVFYIPEDGHMVGQNM